MSPLRQKNVLGIVALVLAILGLIFAVMPGALILGWILLPIAFILSIVALVVPAKKRGAAIAALIIAVVGTIAGFVAFFVTLGNAFDDAIGSTTVTAAPQQPAADSGETDAPSSTEASADEPAAAALGTRDAPYPIGTTLSTDEWDVTINSFIPDATEAVLAENQFNDEPAEGTQYALVNATLTYKGKDSSTSMMVNIGYVTATGEVVKGYDAMVVGPDEIGINELYAGGSVTGNEVLQIPISADGLIRVTPGMFSDDVFVALK